ncbi:MAG: ABC transporter ATP-binding protein [Oscillospiraceae bacterium]|nr:ABC transporter ATP-binding protein [Oscillospiraceae bacterium]
MSEQFAVEMQGIVKTFPGIVACDNVSLEVRKGEIHALLGENGAGKSTLMSILFGMYQPEAGVIKVNGKEVHITGPRDATALGIGMVHQHFKLVDCFSVTRNIVLGDEPMKRGVLDLNTAKKKIMEISERYGLAVDPDALISDITVGMQQRVEILKILYRESDILIFDEPTAVLTPQEIEELIKIIRGLAAEGKSIIFISHKLDEISKVADRVTILRRGAKIATLDVPNTTKEEMSELMVGRKVSFSVDKGEQVLGDVVLDVKNLVMKPRTATKNLVDDISFQVRRGEIVCIAGIDGNGQSETIYGLTGIMPVQGGTITLNGEDITKATVRHRNLAGISHIPEDRHKYGLILDYNLQENIILKDYFKPGMQKASFINFTKAEQMTEELIEKYDVRTTLGPKTSARSMSGGNQQKAIIAREIEQNSDLLIAVQPTRGLDVGAIEFVHKQLVAQRDAGKAVLMMSLELDEVMDVSDRVLVMFEGKIVADVDPKETTIQQMGLYMAGVRKEEQHA